MELFWSLLLAAASLPLIHASQYTIDTDNSIGARHPISQDRQSLPGYDIHGSPQLFSDRVILTPPVPGHQRAGLWAQHPNNHDEWMLNVEFRVTGSEHPGGSFEIWYAAQKGGASGNGMETVATSKAWDGLALVVHSYGREGRLTAYLNDGKDYSAHRDTTKFAFSHCAFDYRNKGRFSKITITQRIDNLRVEIDGQQCFSADKVYVPKGYYFGVTASSTEPPDSFELFNFLLAGADLPHDAHDFHQVPQPKGGRTGRAPYEGHDFGEWHNEPGEEDHEAAYYRTQESQFADLHNRLLGLTHHIAGLQKQLGMIYEKIDQIQKKEDEYSSELKYMRIVHNKVDALDQRVSSIQSLTAQVASAVGSKDYTPHFEDIRKTLHEHHTTLLYTVPQTVAHVLTTGGPRIGMLVMIVVIVQVALAGSYVFYKRRRNSSPKKYL